MNDSPALIVRKGRPVGPASRPLLVLVGRCCGFTDEANWATTDVQRTRASRRLRRSHAVGEIKGGNVGRLLRATTGSKQLQIEVKAASIEMVKQIEIR